MINEVALHKLSEEDKLILSQMMVAGYDNQRLDANVAAAIENLIGRKLSSDLTEVYPDLLALYRRLGGGIGIRNCASVTLSETDIESLNEANNFDDVRLVVEQRYGKKIRVIPMTFYRYLLDKG
ncbi:hypothetical protein IMAU70035_01559 [Lactiplantibacillus plantarum]|nr:hypothetical protein [Lactiplantibacillus plantarum]MCG0836978.1 hypothetical protein [Lactiplantibacillus plantarum]